jgi:hypothetical protein
MGLFCSLRRKKNKFKASRQNLGAFPFSPQEKEQVQSFEVKPRGFSVLSAGMRKYFSCN